MAGKDAITARRRRDPNAAALSAGAEVGSRHLFVSLDQLVDRADNRDIDMAHAERLAASIERDGLGQPVLARPIPLSPDRYELVAGQHRREAYRILQGRHPGDPRWQTIECIVRPGMGDDAARRLMYATNIPNSDADPAYAAKIFEVLGEEIPRMRAEDPSLTGKRSAEIIAEMVAEAGGERVSARTVARRMKAAADESAAREAEESGGLSEVWGAELGRSALPGSMRTAIASMGEGDQRELYERWEDSGKRKDWLKVELELRAGGADRVAEGALASVERGLALLRRAMDAGAGGEGLDRIRAALAAMDERALEEPDGQ